MSQPLVTTSRNAADFWPSRLRTEKALWKNTFREKSIVAHWDSNQSSLDP